jgi:hypothetical protein
MGRKGTGKKKGAANAANGNQGPLEFGFPDETDELKFEALQSRLNTIQARVLAPIQQKFREQIEKTRRNDPGYLSAAKARNAYLAELHAKLNPPPGYVLENVQLRGEGQEPKLRFVYRPEIASKSYDELYS